MDNENQTVTTASYDEANIIHLDDREHIRRRPGMYIGKLGDGSHSDDGIYVLIKETIDNSIDEFRMGEGKVIEVQVQIGVEHGSVQVRDYGRGIPLGKMVDAVSMLNTGGKYDTKAFKKSVGLNGVGTKAVNMLSRRFVVQAFREGKMRRAEFEQGRLVSDSGIVDNTENAPRGTLIEFEPDATKGFFENYQFRADFIETMMRNYSYLNSGLTLNFNGQKFHSKNGLFDLLTENMDVEPLYPIIHLSGEDIEIALTHTDQNNDQYFSFVNGQHTIQGGTHQAAYREAIGKTIKEFFNKNMDLSDIRNGVVGAIAINVQEPVFESQTKVKLGSKDMSTEEGSVSVNKFVNDFVKRELDNYLHKHPEVVQIMLQKIQESERERKAIAGVTKQARERAKKNLVNNPKLRDCRIHYNDSKPQFASKDSEDDLREQSAIFITEGLSASGSITKSRDVNTQAVFSLRGKPLNCYGLTKKVVYENEEFNCLQSALNIEEGLDDLRYNKVIIATDADVDGMHIRLLMLTFFLQFFPDLVKKGHVYILQTPLFRVKNKKETRYCYSEEERLQAIEDLKPSPEITRFKGLGEISPDEFKGFIGKEIRLDQVTLRKEDAVADLMGFYMGKNTAERQNFIIGNLKIEEDAVES
ncbi:MAG: type IIA DNA topoisomerase subunit B [Paludibacteraceae bacterium]|nr:type IIA DNA topoisomerase subunit B [Paludibacteraceae bacterium]MBR4460582.1 type IIA DNA topoisomerase subunit B [Paludibacteraceae bacterium]MBR6145435.1 type IIA DNA topoisomerase subunit B [Paludibacteraceae bacterium]